MRFFWGLSSLLFVFSGLDGYAQNPFVSIWKTDNISPNSSNGTSITIPTTGGGYKYDVDWEGDGTYDDFSVSGSITHNYGSAGTYTVVIRGDFPRIYFNNTGDRLKLLMIEDFGDIAWTSMERAFEGCANLTINTSTEPDLSNVASTAFMFRNATNFNSSINHWNMGTVENFSSMFDNASSFNQPLNGWNTSSATNMSSMFRSATAFNQDLSNWDVSHVEFFSLMFLGATSFDQSLASWSPLAVTTMSSMLSSCNMSHINYDALLISWASKNLPTGISFGVSGRIYCKAADARDILTSTKSWSISGDQKECYFASTWKTDNPGLSNNNQIIMPVNPTINYLYDIDWDGDGHFDQFGIDVENIFTYDNPGTYTIYIRGQFPAMYLNNQGDKDKLISIDQWGDGNWQSMENAFYGCSNLEILAEDVPNISGASNMENTFRNCPLVNHDFGTWNIGSINNMTNVFNGTSIDVTNYDAILRGWSKIFVQTNVPLGAQGLLYCLSDGPRNILINKGWDISGDAQQCTGIERPFKISIKTDNPGISPNNGFRIYHGGTFAYDYEVDWDNDGIFDNQYSPGLGEQVQYSFPSVGTYIIGIRGTFPKIHFYTGGTTDGQKVISIEQWGDQQWLSMENAFRDCSYVVCNATDAPDLSSATSMRNIFANASNLIGDLSNWQVGGIIDMHGAFLGCTSFNSDISQWNVGQVQTMSSTFQNSALNANLGGWNIQNVTNMFDMLDGSAMSLDNYDNTLIGWAAQSVQPNVPLGALDLVYCEGESARGQLIGQGWSIEGDSRVCDAFVFSWKTDQVTPTKSDITILASASSAISYNFDVDWENDGIFDETGVTGNISHDFGTPGTYTIAIRGQFGSPQFAGSLELQSIDQWGDIRWEDLSGAFSGCLNLENNAVDAPDLSSLKTFGPDGISLGNMFRDCILFDGDLNGWDVSMVNNMSNMFYGAVAFNGDISSWNTISVTKMIGMFDGASLFNQHIGGWNVSNVTSMKNMFRNAISFNQDIGNWLVGQVTDMEAMFENAEQFNQDIGGWDVSQVTTMNGMFAYTEAFNADISGWITTDLGSLSFTFAFARSFNQNLGNWNISDVSTMSQMLSSSGLSIPNYDATLLGWSVQNVSSNLEVGVHGLRYCDGANARSILINTRGWTFVSDQSNCDCGNITNFWDGPDSGDWNEWSNWSQNKIPTECHNVVIPAGKSVRIPYNLKANCRTMEVEVGASLDVEPLATLITLGN